MTNLAKSFEAKTNGEPILAAVIGQHYNNDLEDEPKAENDLEDEPKAEYVGKILPWDLARPILDYEYDSGIGGADCHPVYAWTATKVFFVAEYDGATSIYWLPRNPIVIEPQFSGHNSFD